MRKASRSVTQLYDDYLQPTGLRPLQVVVPSSWPGTAISMGRLAWELMLSPSTLSRNLRPLERMVSLTRQQYETGEISRVD
ncbi:MAG: hypothetical protein R3F37_18350 [Candidatus Competibacteraceae bacterium]